MARKEENLLWLSPSSAPASSSADLVPFGGGRALTHDEQRTTEEWHKQTLVIKATTAKTVFGQSEIAEIHKHGAVEFEETVGYLVTLRAEARGKDHQAYVEEFAAHQIQSLAKHMLGTIEVGATSIGYEINRSLYLAPEPRGFWARLLDGS